MSESDVLRTLGARLITNKCKDWPSSCTADTHLRVMGTIGSEKKTAVIGSRKPTRQALHRARLIAQLLVRAGRTVVSGGAFGIDIAALEAAHERGGRTLTVLGSGLSYPSPIRHCTLYGKFVKRGALLSPFPCDQRPARWTFAKRNRWIAECSDEVVVVQAAAQSGTLMAGRRALALRRPVYVDVRKTDHRYDGCLALLREGAQHFETWVVKMVASNAQFSAPTEDLPQLHRQLLMAIETGLDTPILISEHLAMPVHSVLGKLTQMRLKRLVGQNENGSWFRLGLPLEPGGTSWLNDGF